MLNLHKKKAFLMFFFSVVPKSGRSGWKKWLLVGFILIVSCSSYWIKSFASKRKIRIPPSVYFKSKLDVIDAEYVSLEGILEKKHTHQKITFQSTILTPTVLSCVGSRKGSKLAHWVAWVASSALSLSCDCAHLSVLFLPPLKEGWPRTLDLSTSSNRKPLLCDSASQP